MYQEKLLLMAEKIAKRVKKELPNITISVKEMEKNNLSLVGLEFRKEGYSVAPIVYLPDNICELEEMYHYVVEQYEVYENYYEEAEKETKIFFKENTKEDILSKVSARIVHEQKWSKAVVGRNIANLRMYYVVNSELGDKSNAVINITPGMAEHFGITEEELYEASKSNLDVDVDSLMDICKKSVAHPELLEESADMPPMIVISNKTHEYGAVAALGYMVGLRELSGLFNEDLFVIPSSVHECIILPYIDDVQTRKGLYQMLWSVNAELEKFEPESLLSNTLYKYERESGTILELIY